MIPTVEQLYMARKRWFEQHAKPIRTYKRRNPVNNRKNRKRAKMWFKKRLKGFLRFGKVRVYFGKGPKLQILRVTCGNWDAGLLGLGLPRNPLTYRP